jgi:hypothetical protein
MKKKEMEFPKGILEKSAWMDLKIFRWLEKQGHLCQKLKKAHPKHGHECQFGKIDMASKNIQAGTLFRNFFPKCSLELCSPPRGSRRYLVDEPMA